MTPGRAQPIDRASADDVMALVADRHDPPMQVGAVLLLEVTSGFTVTGAFDDADGSDAVRLTEAIRDRLTSVPRLRQRLVDSPLGCGRPVWVDFAEFAFEEHFALVRSPEPFTEDRVLEVAAVQLTTRLPRERPLWAATLLVGPDDRPAAMVLVFHHVLADGIGGLAVLGRLVDGAPAGDNDDFPHPAPGLVRLGTDAALSRGRSVRQLPGLVRRLASAVVELRPSLGTSATRCSLNRQTGPHRRLRTVQTDLDPVARLAHRNGATVNDVLLAAVTGALRWLLLQRGEDVSAFVVSVPFSSRAQDNHGEMGNQSGVVPLLLSATGTLTARIASIVEVTRAAKRHQRGASTALLGPVFRLLAALGLYQYFIDHQRSIHTFVSDLKGPESRLTLLGCPITGVVPLAVATGNITVAFTALSYAGRLVISISADPDTCPDLDDLRRELQSQLDLGVESLLD